MRWTKQLNVVLIGILVMTSELCWAQEKINQSKQNILSEIVVTATKFEIPVKNTSRQVQIISSEEIQQSEACTIAQILQRQSGLIINGAYSNLGAVKSLYMRGATNNFASILIDGIPINDPSGVGGALDLRFLPLGNIEHIEIIKGSQSSLYGSGAISGVINIVTKKTNKNKIGMDGALSVGSFNSNNARLNIGGSTSHINYNIGIQHLFTEGISQAKKPKSSLSSFDKDKFVQTGSYFNFGFKPTKKITINPYVRFTQHEGDYDAGAFKDAKTNRYSTEFLNAGGIITYTSKKIKTRLAYGYTHTYRFDKSLFGESKSIGILNDLDGYVSYKFNHTFNISGGINYQNQYMRAKKGTKMNPSESITSTYWQMVITPAKGFITELNYRLNIHSQYGINSTYSIAPAYWLTKDIKILASYNTGYKTPTLSQLYGKFGANKLLKPQLSTSWEIGGQFHSSNKKIIASITYYNRTIKDLIVYEPQPTDSNPFNAQYVNRDIQKNGGIETNITWSIKKNLRLKLTYDFMVGNITERKTTSQDIVYNNLIRRPPHSIKTTIGYHPIPRLFINLNGQFIGNRKDIFFEGLTKKIVNLDSYFLLNIYIDYEAVKGNIHFFADLKNITDITFFETYGYATRGFDVQIGLRFRL